MSGLSDYLTLLQGTISVTEAAAALHKTPRTIRRLCASGKIVALRYTPTGWWRIAPSSLGTYLALVSAHSRPRLTPDERLTSRGVGRASAAPGSMDSADKKEKGKLLTESELISQPVDSLTVVPNE